MVADSRQDVESTSAMAVPPSPPQHEDGQAWVAWANHAGVGDRLDDVMIGPDGPAPSYFRGASSAPLTYRQVLLGPRELRPYGHLLAQARAFAVNAVQQMAAIVATRASEAAYLEAHGRDPDDGRLLALLAVLRAARREMEAGRSQAPRPSATYEMSRPVTLAREPLPLLVYTEQSLLELLRDFGGIATNDTRVGLSLVGWEDGALAFYPMEGEQIVDGEVEPPLRVAALAAFIDLLRDPRAVDAQQGLAELLAVPAWSFTLDRLDRNLARLDVDAARGAESGRRGSREAPEQEQRLAFRVGVSEDGDLTIDPVLQTRARSAGARATFSRGKRVAWFDMPSLANLSPAAKRAFRAYEDRFARRTPMWNGSLQPTQVFGILRALVDHPLVFLEGQRPGGRLDIRHGRLRLGFAAAPDGSVTARFDLMGHNLLPSEAARALRDDRHLVWLDRSDPAAPRVYLAELAPQAAAVVRALALGPTRFPPDAHDALVDRLESLQAALDIEFPSLWTRTIAPADARIVFRLELLVSGALKVGLGVRPVASGIVYPPGEGPALLLEGSGRDRHAARRDLVAERQGARALVERLRLDAAEAGAEGEPWSWRVAEGDPSLELIAALKDLSDVVVEWADDARLFSLGSVGRSDMRMHVADRRDWFSVEGGADVANRTGPASGTRARRRRQSGTPATDAGAEPEPELIPLATLLAAMREGRRYVVVGARGFVRIEESLRQALERADAALFATAAGLQISAVGSDALMGLVERDDQLNASAAFQAVRRRIEEGGTVEPRLLPAMKDALRPYQLDGVRWMSRLAHWGAGAILADEMGLGKTIQTLAVLSHRAADGPAIVVAPTSVTRNWIDEAAKFAPELRVRLYRGPDRAAILPDLRPGDLLVTSYTIAALDAEALHGVPFATLVLDEAQAIKNAATDRARTLRDLQATWRIALTGTPIENRLGELWSIMRVISPGLLGSWEQFRARFAVPIEKFGDENRRRALALALRPFVLRRTKADVAPELPARTEVVRAIALSTEESALYQQLRTATLAEIAAAKQNRDRDASDMRFLLLAALTRLRQLCCHPRLVYPRSTAGSAKAAHLVDLLEELREGDHSVLVFSQFRSFLDLLLPRLRQHGFRVLVLDGTTPAELREQRVAAFQRGEADVFLISLKAGGFGLNLTAADTVIHLDPWWNPAVEDQATARAHRIGQQRPVTAIRLVARDTIEEAVLSLHDAKRALAAGILEGTDVVAGLDTEALVDLIRRGTEA